MPLQIIVFLNVDFASTDGHGQLEKPNSVASSLCM